MTRADMIDPMIIDALKTFSGKGLFELSKEQQMEYENSFFKVSKRICDEMFELVPDGTPLVLFINEMEGIKEYYKAIEDYEMLYLIDNVTKRTIKYYEHKIQNR